MVSALSTPSAWNRFKEIPAYSLTDFDPDGLAISDVYRLGSDRLAHEGEALMTAKLQRIGLDSSHICEFVSGGISSGGLLALTRRDRRMAQKMLESGSRTDSGIRDLQLMLMLNRKAELQILDDWPGKLAEVLRILST